MQQFICELAAIPDKSGREFEVNGVMFVVVRMGETAFAYRNYCPHRGTPLNWMPDQFMDYDRQYIQCATHGALFDPASGKCLAGPCAGDYLDGLVLNVTEGKVFLVQEA